MTGDPHRLGLSFRRRCLACSWLCQSENGLRPAEFRLCRSDGLPEGVGSCRSCLPEVLRLCLAESRLGRSEGRRLRLAVSRLCRSEGNGLGPAESRLGRSEKYRLCLAESRLSRSEVHGLGPAESRLCRSEELRLGLSVCRLCRSEVGSPNRGVFGGEGGIRGDLRSRGRWWCGPVTCSSERA